MASTDGFGICEFAQGVDSLERFVRQEPLRRVHECVFGVLAMESEPVDLRLWWLARRFKAGANVAAPCQGLTRQLAGGFQ